MELEEEVTILHSQLETANSKLETVLAHSVCANWEIKSLKECLNSKINTKKQKVQVNAQYVLSTEATLGGKYPRQNSADIKLEGIAIGMTS